MCNIAEIFCEVCGGGGGVCLFFSIFIVAKNRSVEKLCCVLLLV